MECRWGQREIVTCIHCWWECKMTMQSLWKTSLGSFSKAETTWVTTWPSNSIPRYVQKRNEKYVHKRTDVPSRIINNSLKLGGWVKSKGLMNLVLRETNGGIIHPLKRIQVLIHATARINPGNTIKWKKPMTKGHMLHDSIHTKWPEQTDT